jgi:tRNA threonylcarbamoyladenosine biosynthesis protein TsaB
MLILALDTTTRAGSLALRRDETVLAAERGDETRSHGVRLPGEIVRLLARHDVRPAAVDVLAVAAGPGSFTGLRIGIATMQGLAVAHRKGLVGVSALDALALGTARELAAAGREIPAAIAVWMDARRREVFAGLYRGSDLALLDGPIVAAPSGVLARWAAILPAGRVWFVGDGALAYRALVEASPSAAIVEAVPLVAPWVAVLAARAAVAGPLPGPELLQPLYVRRPDAELARDRAAAP